MMGMQEKAFMKKLLLMLGTALCLCMPVQPGLAMSLNVQDADVGELLRSVAAMGGVNLILDQSVTGKVSLKVEEAVPEEIIQNVVKARGLALTKKGNTWIIAGKNNLENSFAGVHVIPIKYAPLNDIQNAAALYLEELKGKRPEASGQKKDGDVKQNATVRQGQKVLTDVSTGSLLVYGTEEEAAAVRALVEKLDVPAKQVSIEAKVVSMSKEDASKLGIQWDWSTLPTYSYNGEEGDAERQALPSGSVGGIVSFGKGPGGHPYEWQYAATLEALVTNGRAEVLSRPNIITLQGQEAVINIGSEVPVPSVSTTNSTVTTSIEYRPAGIILRCLPMVNEDGYITSRIHTEVSAPSYVEEMNAYSFQKRSADTIVRLKDGETMVIGGLISSEEIRSMSKVPFLGDLPILGNLFKSVHKSTNNSEIFIILKAAIVS